MYVDDDMLDQLTEDNNYTYASIIPLIGGETIAMQNAFGKKPKYIMSYKVFGANDSQLLNHYKNEIPYHILDEGGTHGGQVDVVNSVCPCAGLSMLNTSASADNAANDWMVESADYVLGQVQPKVFWGENAPGLYGNMGKPVVEKLRKVGDKYGYTMTLYKTKSTLHGLGQVRNRSFYFFWKDDVVPFMKYFNKEKEPIEECIRNAFVSEDDPMNELVNDNKPSEDPWYAYVLDKLGLTHKEFYSQLESSTNPLNWVEQNEGIDGFMNAHKWFKENGYEKPAASAERMYKKLKSGGNIMRRCVELGKGHTSAFVGHFAKQLAHPDEDRYITIREALSIMKMPKDFQLVGGRKNLNMICQNVPVSTAQDMAECVKDYLDGKLDTMNARFIRQSNVNRSHELEENTLEEFLV
jgi:site-specific DNA-cytosine methylase